MAPSPSDTTSAAGLRLNEAVETYCDPGKFNAFETAKAELAYRRSLTSYVFTRNSNGTIRRPDVDRAAAACASALVELYAEFFQKLISGELEATYLPNPPPDDFQRKIVSPNVWATLSKEMLTQNGWPGRWYIDLRASRLSLGSSYPKKATNWFGEILIYPSGAAPVCNPADSALTTAPAERPSDSRTAGAAKAGERPDGASARKQLRRTVVRDLIRAGNKPPGNIIWKAFLDLVCARLGANVGDKGLTLKTIQGDIKEMGGVDAILGAPK